MVQLKDYARKFIKDEEGAELIEWAIGVAIAGLLIGVAFTIASNMRGSLEQTSDALNDGLGNFNSMMQNDTNGSEGGNT